jgi:tRNA modification GTPase
MCARSLPGGLPHVALVGWPNTGKSSLFNALAKSDRSIVSPAAGTTRDYLQATVDFDGLEGVLVDTAGIETAAIPNGIAAAAQSMTESQGESADLRILCIDATRLPNAWEQLRLHEDLDTVIALTKCDLPRIESPYRRAMETSALTGHGLDRLRQEIASRLAARPAPHAVASTAARCRASVERAIESINTAYQLVEQSMGNELIAAEIRLGLNELGKVTGAVFTEDVLDRIFSRFCIGK